jgi:hypothetical protein
VADVVSQAWGSREQPGVQRASSARETPPNRGSDDHGVSQAPFTDDSEGRQIASTRRTTAESLSPIARVTRPSGSPGARLRVLGSVVNVLNNVLLAVLVVVVVVVSN